LPEKSEEEISELLFTLASADRLALLSSINNERQRLTNLSKVINASAQECSRHLSRLTDAGLIKKDSESLYYITPLGSGILHLLPGLKFLLANRNYFRSHDLSFLPQSFLERIGELAEGEYVEHFSQILDRIKTTITTGREYVWLISDQPIVVGNAPGVSFHSKELPARFIFESSVDRKTLDEIAKALPNSKIAILDDIRLAMGINEKVAGVIFPKEDGGEIDFGGGFYSEETAFHNWCTDLFDFYWKRAKMFYQR
jgi:predicted transcriptional regulator